MKQSSGDSLRRQSTAAREFCNIHNLKLVETFTDSGVSGYKGKNFSHESALSQFLRMVEGGTIQANSVLILESMDRLSRQSILPCLGKFMEIINKGISLGVISQGKILTQDSITKNPMELMLVLVEFARANNESEMKSQRIKAVISKKVELVKAGQKIWFGAGKPTWIIDLKDDTFIMDTKRVKIVQDVFKRYLKGQTTNKIAESLNQKKTQTLRSFKNSMWTNAGVAELLRNKNVLGWFHINGVEIDNYYPAIITEKDFQEVQQKLAFNIKRHGGSKLGLVRNLFRGLLYCPICGQVITLRSDAYKSVTGGIIQYTNYQCFGSKLKNGCTNKGRFPVSEFEKNFFDFILPAQKIESSKKSKTVNQPLINLENELAKTERKINQLVEMLETEDLSDMAELSVSFGKFKKQREALKQSIQSEKNKVAARNNVPQAAQSLWELRERHMLGLTVTDTKEREYIRNILPNLYKKVTLEFGAALKAAFHRQDGETDTMTLKR
jgi:DNA invertase Pin-like site-specific DNA recombinase